MAITKKINYSAEKSKQADNQLASMFGGFNTAAIPESDIKMLPVEQIQLDPKGEFQKLFPINESDLGNIVESMKKKGFLKHQHLLVATIIEEDMTILVDGHTRLKAARAAGIDEVPVYEITAETRKEAKIACYEMQLFRRNLSDGQKLMAIEAMDVLKNPGRKSSDSQDEPSGKSAERLGEQLGMSTRQVEKGRAILASGDEETIEKVKNDEMSFSAGYDKVKGKSKKKDGDEDEDFDDISDSLEDTSGDPKGIVIGDHSDHIERPTNKLSPEQDSERTLERRRAYESGCVDGFLQCAKYIFAALRDGAEADEIESIINGTTSDYENLLRLKAEDAESEDSFGVDDIDFNEER